MAGCLRSVSLASLRSCITSRRTRRRNDLDHPGSIAAAMMWLVVSLGLKFYVDNFGSSQRHVWRDRRRDRPDVMVLPLGPGGACGGGAGMRIEHASPWGDPGERVAGERRPSAAWPKQAWRDRKALKAL